MTSPRWRLCTRTDHPVAPDVAAELAYAVQQRIDQWRAIADDERCSEPLRAIMRYKLQQVAELPVVDGADKGKLWKWVDGA